MPTCGTACWCSARQTASRPGKTTPRQARSATSAPTTACTTKRPCATPMAASRSRRSTSPTVLITTSVRQLGDQLESRLFRLEVPDDQDSIRAALAAQAAVEVAGAAEPDPALVAAQAYLQRLAPWDVVVPYAGELAALIGRSPAAPRIKRDFARLLSLIKAHAVLCHGQRSRDASGRLVASAEDYATVYELMGDVYAQSASGASLRIREVVEAVRELRGGTAVRITAVAARLGINKMAASRRVNAALRAGYLVNNENRRGQPASLDLG